MDKATLQDRAQDGALEDAEELVEGRAVLSIVTRESSTEGRVLGRKSYPHHHVVHSEPDPDAAGVEATCTCTSDDAAWCKHVLAVLLTADQQPALAEERETIPAELGELPRDELEALTERLLQEKAGLEDVVDVHVELASARQAAGDDGEETVGVDPAVFRRRVDMILHGGYFGTFHSHTRAQATAEAMEDLVDGARELVELGHPPASLDVLEALTEAYLDGWDVIKGLGGWPNQVVDELTDALEDTLQEANLSETKAGRWRSRLEDWQAEVQPYGHDEGFNPALAVLEEA